MMENIQKKDDKGLGINALDINIEQIENFSLPPLAPDGRIPTLNKGGYSTFQNDEISQQFIEYASKQKLPVLDGGAAYGVCTIEAIKKGATVIANDSCVKHLEYLLKNTNFTKEEKKRLFFKPGFLPNGIDFKENSLCGIHLSRVMHFFHPNEIEEMFRRSKKWLINKGLLFIIIMSPWHHSAVNNFSEIYDEKYKKGELFPGQINDFTISSSQEMKNDCSEYLHAIDPRVMMRLANQFDFTVKKLQVYGGVNDSDYTGAILINNKK